MKPQVKGALATALSAVVFGLMPLITAQIYATGSDPITVVFLRFTISLPVILLILRAGKVPLAITRQELGRVALLAVAGYGGTALIYFAAFARIPSGLTVTLHFIYPVLVILAGALFFRQKPGWPMVLSVVLCLVGIVLLSGASAGADPLGVALALLSGVTYAFYIVYLDRSGLGSMHPIKLIFYMNALAAVMMLVFSRLSGGLHLPQALSGWFWVVVLSLLISLGAVRLLQVGIKLVGPQQAAILSTFEPLTGVLAGVLIRGEPFTLLNGIGSVLVLVSVVLVTAKPTGRGVGEPE